MRPIALIVCALGLLVSGCKAVVLHPAGHVAVQQRDLLVTSVVLMLIIIVPVMALTVFFALKYRASNEPKDYDPEWHHSTHLELVIWAAPLLIIICLGAVTWTGTHLLDPYRPLDRVGNDRPVAADVRPLEVQVVALDWKWLFIYPEYGIATINELAAPVDRPIAFSLTSSSVMNSFYIPALAGQIYAMPGMETKLHGVINAPGDYKGFSANYSGAGFSGMRFTFKGMDPDAFQAWVDGARQGGGNLDKAVYLQLERPSEHTPVQKFAVVDPRLWSAVVNRCVEPGKMCMNEMMAFDARGGLGIESAHNTLPVAYNEYARGGSTALGGQGEAYVLTLCTPEEAAKLAKDRERLSREALFTPRHSLDRLQGAGLPRPTSFSTAPPLIQTASLDTGS